MANKPNIFEQHNMQKKLGTLNVNNISNLSMIQNPNTVRTAKKVEDKKDTVDDILKEYKKTMIDVEKFCDFDCLNIGIPTTLPLFSAVPYGDFMKVCDPKAEKRLGHIINYNMDALFDKINKDIGVNYSFLKPFTKTCYSVYTDENLKTYVVFSNFGFFCDLMTTFNFKGNGKVRMFEDLPSGINYLREALKDLRQIKYPKELKRKYPELYKKYETIKQYIEGVKKINKKSPMEKIKFINTFNNIFGDFYEYLEFSKDFSIEKYISEISDMYEKYFINLKDILKLISSTPIYFTEDCMIDENKMALLIAYVHLLNSKIHAEDMQKYLYYISSYLREFKTKHNNVSIEIYDALLKGSRSQKSNIDYNYIKDAFKEVLVESPELNFIDLSRERFTGMTPEEIDSYMEEYIEYVRLNWDFLLPNDESIERKTLELINKESRSFKVKDEEEFKRQKLELYYEKKELFESSEPFCILEGKAAFNGYRAFCYYNGKVILDKYFANEKTGRLAFGDAIYVMDLASFYMLSKMSKAEIINGNLCRRIYHRGNWKQKTLDIINSGDAVSMDSSLAHEFKKLKARKG